MPNDPLFERRISNALTARAIEAEHKKMFGGVAFMVRGHMTVGITNKGDFMVRFDGTRHAEIAEWPGAKPMTFGKGEMKGFLFVDAGAVRTAAALGRWVDLAMEHNASLPAKAPGTKTAGSKTKQPAPKKTTARKQVRKR
jgi:hypothetical protein